MRENPMATFRRSEYTGDDRCLPCTATNVFIAVVLGGGLLVAGAWIGATTVGALAGLCVFVVSLLVIYLRGYLFPGTPTLTRRYFPGWLLRVFGKASKQPTAVDLNTDDGADPEGMLSTDGVLEASSDGDGLGLTDEFRTEWTRAVDEATGIGREELSDVLDTSGDVDLEEWGDVFRMYVDDQMVGKWRSRAAFVADVASKNVLSDRSERWDGLSVDERARVLDRLRTYAETCPGCGGTTEGSTETVEGCCSTFEAFTVSCPDCGAQLSIETCPECGDVAEYSTEVVETDGAPVEVAVASCQDGHRVSVLPAPLSEP